MKPKIIFRADGGLSIGMGHVVRSLALADMLHTDFEIIFAIQQPDSTIIKLIQESTNSIIILPQTDDYLIDAVNFSKYFNSNDIVVLDGYNFSTEYQLLITSSGCSLVCIDDLHAWHQLADVLINHAEGIKPTDYSTAHNTRFCLGLDYVLLRKEFLHPLQSLKKISEVKNVFISMGAADIQNLSEKFTRALLSIHGIEEIHLMLGAINPHLECLNLLIQENSHVKIQSHFNITAFELKKILGQCALAICPASSISLECSAVGIGLISGYTAANQIGILDSLIKYNAAVNFGDFTTLSIEDINEKIQLIITQPAVINDLIHNQNKMIDGKSPERLLNVFRELSASKIKFRFADINDMELYFNWTNDPLVRANSYQHESVSYEDHKKWFQSKVNSTDCQFYLFYKEVDFPIGQVRIDKNGNEVVIGISIGEKSRGKSYGPKMLKAATSDYLKKNPNAIIFAYIKEENIPSQKIFLCAGFNIKEKVNVHGHKSLKLQKT